MKHIPYVMLSSCYLMYVYIDFCMYAAGSWTFCAWPRKHHVVHERLQQPVVVALQSCHVALGELGRGFGRLWGKYCLLQD